jgi:phosphatidylglycerophosphatase A
MSDLAWAWTLLIGLMGGIWASTYTARQLGHSDPSAIVCDEILAFWLILWLITPTPFWEQLLAFGLFRYFDAAKPGPVHWADQRFKAAPPALDGVPDDASKITWRQGWGIMFDDLVAAFCTLFVIALLRKVF